VDVEWNPAPYLVFEKNKKKCWDGREDRRRYRDQASSEENNRDGDTST